MNGPSIKRIYPHRLLPQMSIIALVVTTIILSLFGFNAIRTQKKELYEDLTARVEANSSWLTTALTQPLYNLDDTTVASLCNSLLTVPAIFQITVEADYKKMVFSSESSAELLQAQTEILSVKKRVEYPGLEVGKIEILASTKHLREQVKMLGFRLFLQILILDAALVAAIIFLLTRKFILPLKQLQASAGKIASGDLSSVIEVRSKNELGSLGDALEEMRLTLREKIVTLENEIAMRTRAEEEREQAIDYVDAIINSMPSTIVGVGADLTVSHWNQLAESVSGLSAEEAKGMDIQEALVQIPLDRDEIHRAINSRELVQHQIRDDKNGERFLDITIFPLDYKGRQGAVIRVDDVTEQHQMRQELAHTRKLDAIGQLAGGVAHDFNNMLAGIISGAELLSLNSKNDAKAQKYIDIILQAGKQAGDLTHKLLAFARKGKVESTPIDVAKVIYDAASILNHTLDRRIKVDISVDAENTRIIGDLSQIQNALINLGVNGGHAMAGDGVLQIQLKEIIFDEVYCKASPFDIVPGAYLDLEVHDTGVGIAPENIERIFEPFYTTKDVGKGSGLGLSAVYGAVLEHNGAITVYSEPGRGTSFHLYLPLTDVEDTIFKKEADRPISGQGTILIVDDEQVVLVTAKSILESLGYDVILAGNGKDGLQKYREHRADIDLVIIDMIMPEMNGKDCYFAMKAMDNDVKVLLASGFSREADLKELQENGLAGFLHKPYTTVQLSRAVAAAVK